MAWPCFSGKCHYHCNAIHPQKIPAVVSFKVSRFLYFVTLKLVGRSTDEQKVQQFSSLLFVYVNVFVFSRFRAARRRRGGGGETKKNRSSSKSDPDMPTPTLPSATPDYAAGLGVEFPLATPTSSRGSGDVTGGRGQLQARREFLSWHFRVQHLFQLTLRSLR